MPSRRRPTLTRPTSQETDTANVAAASDFSPGTATHDDIAQLAYRRAESRGFAPGLELEDWLWAEATLYARFCGTPADDDAKLG